MDSGQTTQGQMGGSGLTAGAVGAMEGHTQKRTIVHAGWCMGRVEGRGRE